MSRSAWDSPSLDGDVDSNPNGSSSLSRQPSVSISRSQDDATVSYYFQRPQSENDLQAYGGGKRWAIGDDMLVEQAKSVSDLEREFHNISLGSDFSTKKFWEIDDGHVSDGKGTMFTASSPWSPRQSTWSSPTTDNNVAQSLQSFQPVSLTPDAMPYGLGDHITKNFSGLRSLKNEFAHDTDNDIIKTPKKTSKTSSPFEPVENKNNVDNQNDLLHNGDDGFRVLRMESPLTKLRDDEANQIGPQKAIGSTPTKKQPPSSHSESFAPILNHASAMGQLNVSQPYSRLGNMAGTLDALSFPDYSVPSLPTIDSPAANQFSGIAPPLDYNPNSMMAQQNFVAMSTSQAYSQQQQPPSLYSMNSVNMSLQQPPLPPPPQQQPLQTPVGQANQVPFNMFNQQQTQYGMQQAAQQQTPSQQQMAPAGAAMNVPNSMNNTTSTQQQQQPMTVLPHPSASFMINGQDPHAMGMAMGPFQYVQTPWGIFPASVITSHQPMAGQQQQQNPQSQASQRPLTPNQQQQQLGNLATDGLPAQQQQMNTQQVQMAPNFIDMSNGYPTAPTILAFYDQNGHLVTVNNGRSIPATPVRLVSPAPFIYNPGPNNMQQQQPPQGFGGAAPANFTSSNGAPPSVNNMNGVPAVNSMHATNMQANIQTLNQTLPMSSNTNSFPQTMNIPNSDFVPQRQDSFSGPGDKYGMYGGGMNIASTPAGPLGLVQPPPPPATPPALGGTTGLGLGLGSGGRLYNAAPGAEATYRNSLGPHAMPSNMANPGGSGGGSVFNNRPSKENVPMSRSRLLEEFRGNRLPTLQLKDLNHHVVEFSQDQHGSRFIQQKLERASVMEKQLVFNEILSAAYSLMTDVFGNYVIQKFFEFGLPDHKQTLAQKLNGQVLPLALQMYGCRVIQKALESIPSDMQIAIVKELDGHVLKCVKDQNGNHVVQKCIECVEPIHLHFIIEAFHGQVYLLSTHPYGCRVIQRILEHCMLEQTAVILSELHEQTDRLVLDQYGNYVIQHVLEHGRMEEKSKIVSHIRGKVLPLSQHKFASNVVEKCVSNSSRAEKAMLIEEVCSASESGQSALYIMMKDQYANYVIQKMLDIAEPNQRKILVHKIRPHIATLRKYTYGKHIIAKLEKYLMKNGGGDLSSGSPLGLSM